MTKKAITLLALAALALPLLACNQRTDKDEGDVILTIAEFDELPFRVSVNNSSAVQVGELTLQNVPKDPNGTVSSLMDIELQTFEVVYTRADAGTRRPPSRVAGVFSNVPVNSQTQILDLDVMGLDQLLNPPLSDLLFENGGLDSETGSPVIQINFNLRFFGRTLAGDDIVSNTASFRIEFVP